MTERMSDEYAAEAGKAATAVEAARSDSGEFPVPAHWDRPTPRPQPASRDEHDKANQNTTAVGTGRRADAGKLRYDLLPVGPLAEVARVYTLGAVKYGAQNWRGGIAYPNCLAAMMRHIEQWRSGESRDPDGQHHMASVVFWALAVMQYEMNGQAQPETEITEEERETMFAPIAG